MRILQVFPRLLQRQYLYIHWPINMDPLNTFCITWHLNVSGLVLGVFNQVFTDTDWKTGLKGTA